MAFVRTGRLENFRRKSIPNAGEVASVPVGDICLNQIGIEAHAVVVLGFRLVCMVEQIENVSAVRAEEMREFHLVAVVAEGVEVHVADDLRGGLVGKGDFVHEAGIGRAAEIEAVGKPFARRVGGTCREYADVVAGHRSIGKVAPQHEKFAVRLVGAYVADAVDVQDEILLYVIAYVIVGGGAKAARDGPLPCEALAGPSCSGG